jgi:hypothetical protein
MARSSEVSTVTTWSLFLHCTVAAIHGRHPCFGRGGGGSQVNANVAGLSKKQLRLLMREAEKYQKDKPRTHHRVYSDTSAWIKVMRAIYLLRLLHLLESSDQTKWVICHGS